MRHIEDILDAVGERLATFTSSDVVVGSPIELGSTTVVPLSRVSVGIGGGGGSGEGGNHRNRSKHQPGKGIGGGTGGGAKLRPVAVAVFRADSVDVLPIPGKKGKLDKLLDNIPELIERLQKAKEGAGENGGKAKMAFKLGSD